MGALSLKGHPVLQPASPSYSVGWEKGWEESLTPPLGCQCAGMNHQDRLILSLSSPQSKRSRGTAEGAGAES